MADVKFPVLSINEIAKQAAEIALDGITFETGGKTYTLREFTDKIQKGEFAEVRHGRWLKIEPSGTQFRRKCSECGGIVHAVSDFCPFCGARMDAVDDQSGGAENAVT